MSFRFFIASFLLLMMTFSFSLGVVFADVHYANPGNYKSVLGAAGYSDTIIFRDGVYGVDEPIEVLESWKLVAANPGAAVLRATRSIHTLIDVWSSDVVVSGLVLDGNGLSNYGIHGNYEGHYAIDGNFNGNTIVNNRRFGVLLTNTNSMFSNNYVAGNGEVGIGLLDSPTSTLTGNTVVGSGYTGIYLYNSPGSSLTGNTVNGNGGHGIFLRLSPYSWIQNNNAVGNLWTGINLESSGSSAVVTNTANNNNIAGIWLTGTDSTPIIGNTVEYNPYGVAFTSSNNNQVIYNTVIGNVYGITTPYSNPVSNNLIMDNSGWGINMDTYGNNLNSPPLLDNQIYRNGIGIRLVGNNNILGTFLLENNSVLVNNYALEFAGNGNLLDGTQFYGNTNGLHLIGDNNILTNLTVLYNTQNGLFIEGSNNRLNDSWFVNNTNGLIFNGNGNNINNLFFLNNTNTLTLNGNNNLLNGSGAFNGTQGFFITGTGNVISNNSVSSHNGTAMYINGNNIVTGNSLTDNNGTGLVIRSDNDAVNFLNLLGNTIINNQNGIHVVGDNNNINNLLTLFNIILNNNCTLTITGNNNGMNNTILTLNRNGLVVNGDNNTFFNITSRYNNQNGINLNGNNNTLNGSSLYNNTQGLIINGSDNQVNGTWIMNNTNGTSINGDSNNLTQNNIHNNTENGITLNGTNNTLTQNNITGNSNAILVKNGTNNTLNYNRIAGNTHNLHNQGHGTINAEYNWWGQNTPTCITGMNINAGNHVVAVLNTPTTTINPGQTYTITLNLRSSSGQELTMEIPSFLVQFLINNGGDVYPETVLLTNNTAQTQFVVFNPGTYTITTQIDQQTLTNILSTPVNSQPVVNRVPIKTKSVSSGVTGNGLVGMAAGAEARASSMSQFSSYFSNPILFMDPFDPNNPLSKRIYPYLPYPLNTVYSAIGQFDVFNKNMISLMTFGHTFKEVYNNLPPEIKGNPLIMGAINGYANMMQMEYAMIPFITPYFYLERMFIEPHNNMWDMINPPDFIHFYGLNYENLDPTSKFWIELITGITPQGSMSYVSFILTLLAIATIPLGGEGILAKLGITGLKIELPLLSKIPILGKIELPILKENLQIIEQLGSRTYAPILNKITYFIEKLGISTDLTGFTFDLLSRFSIPFGWNPLSMGIVFVETLAKSSLTASKFSWLSRIVDTPAWTGFSRSLTLGDITALGIGTMGPSEGIWNGIKTGFGAITGGISNTITNLTLNIKDKAANFISNTKNAITNGYKNIIQPALDRFNHERAELVQKGAVKYAQSKYAQAKGYVKETSVKAVKYYNSNVKPWMEHNIKPVAHKIIDPVWNNPVTQWAVKNVPGVKQATGFLGKVGNVLGIW